MVQKIEIVLSHLKCITWIDYQNILIKRGYIC